MTESITILRPTAGVGVDAQGNPNPGTVTETTSPGWAVAPIMSSEEPTEAGAQVVEGYTLYLRDVWADIHPTDQVRVRGDVFGVTSPVNHWSNPRTSALGTVVTVKRVV